jgi:hypothetical protein
MPPAYPYPAGAMEGPNGPALAMFGTRAVSCLSESEGIHESALF